MGRKVSVWVHANGHQYAPGDEPSAEDAKEIRNPACWEDGEAPEAEPEPQLPAPPVDPVPPVGPPVEPEGPAPEVDERLPDVPPKSGRGSGRPHWAEYAEALNVPTVDADGEDLGRDELIDAIDRAGFPTE